jgi:hypothetical protein
MRIGLLIPFVFLGDNNVLHHVHIVRSNRDHIGVKITLVSKMVISKMP